MKDNWWLEVSRFNKSGKRKAVVSFTLPKKDRKLLEDYPDQKINRTNALAMTKDNIDRGFRAQRDRAGLGSFRPSRL